MKLFLAKLNLKILIPVLAVLLAGGGGVLYVNSKLDKLNYQQETVVSAEPTEAPVSTGDERSDLTFDLPDEEKQTDSGIVNILLLGTDRRLPGTSDPGRADCTMLCSLNKGTGEIKLVSFERGIFVPIPEALMPYGGTSDLLTHAYHWGGPELSQSIISTCFNIDIAGYAQVDFDSFQEVVDALGGIDVDITQIEAYGLNKVIYDRHFEEGTVHLNGAEALNYARLRGVDDDWVRQQRQRNTIKACLAKVRSLGLGQLDNLADTVLPLINTNLSKTQIASLLLSAPKFINAEIKTLQVPDKNMTESHYIECDFEYESKKISNFIYGTDYELVCPYTSLKEKTTGHTKEE